MIKYELAKVNGEQVAIFDTEEEAIKEFESLLETEDVELYEIHFNENNDVEEIVQLR